MAKASTIIVPVNADGEVTGLIPTTEITAEWAYLDLVSVTIKLSTGDTVPAGDYVLALVHPQTPKRDHVLLASTDDGGSTPLSASGANLVGVISLDTSFIETALLNAEDTYIDAWLALWDESSQNLVTRVTWRVHDNPAEVI